MSSPAEPTCSLGPGEEATITEEWVVVWFPPEANRKHSFREEAKARAFAARPAIAEWNPLLDHRIITTFVVSELVPL